MNKSTIALLLNWGPIIGIAMFPLQVYITQRSLAGFQHAAILGATLVFAGTVVRTLPCLFSTGFKQGSIAIAMLHFGRILNAAGGPLCMGTESRLSCLWFRENERATATSIAVTSNACGTTVGFLLGPALVKKSSSLPVLLYVEVILAAIPFLCSIAHYPAKPANPPSAAAAAVVAAAEHGGPDAKTDSQQLTFWKGLHIASQNRHFCVLVLAAGIMAGVSAAWQSLLQSILSPSFDDSTIGYLGFGNGLAGNLGSVLVGYLSDSFFRRRFTSTILKAIGLLFVAVVWFTLSAPSSTTATHYASIMPSNLVTLATALALAGLAQAATSPLLYELCAELTFPVPEGTSAGLLALLWNSFSLIVIFLSPVIPSSAINYIMAATTVLVMFMVFSVKESYKRPTDYQDDAAVESDKGEGETK